MICIRNKFLERIPRNVDVTLMWQYINVTYHNVHWQIPHCATRMNVGGKKTVTSIDLTRLIPSISFFLVLEIDGKL